jgi:hypothetical protein
MSDAVKLKGRFVLAAGFAMLAGCAVAQPPPPPPTRVVIAEAPNHHPAYLHALSDLRSARWLIEHRPGNVAQTADEGESVRQINAAINEIKQAAIDDGKNLNDHPPVDANPDSRGRIHQALQFLNKSRADIAREEDNSYSNGLRDRALGHIDGAIQSAHRVLQE